MVIFDGGARDTDRANEDAVGRLQGHAAGERDQTPVGVLYVVERPARLREFANLAGDASTFSQEQGIGDKKGPPTCANGP